MRKLPLLRLTALMALMSIFGIMSLSADEVGPFELVAPADGAVVTDPSTVTEIQWTEAENATEYRFGLDREGLDTHLLTVFLDAEEDLTCENGICTLTVTDEIRALLIDSNYVWRVRGISDDDERNASNNTFSFTVDTPDPIGAFDLLTPPNGAQVNDTSAVTQIQWQQASGATAFNFVLTRTTDSTTVLDLNFGTEICDGTTCTIPVGADVQALLTDGDYSWDVTASNADNSTTSANGPWTFTVDTPDPIGAFDLLTPPNGAQVNDTSAVTQIQWQQASGATAFNFVLTRTTDSTTVLDLNFDTAICDGTTCTIPVGADVQALLTDGDYSWDVTASNADNSTTSANGPWTFTVDTPDPIGAFDLLTPPNGAQVNDTSAVTQIQWEQAQGATNFNFVLTRTTDSTTVLDLNFDTAICDGTTCTIPVGADVQALLTDGDYSWDVTASNADNSTTSANGHWTFTVDTPDPIGAFDLLTPPNGAQVNDTSAVTQIQWEQSSGATNFNFVLTRTTDNTTVLDLNFDTAICDGTTCTIPVGADVQALLTDGDYSWDVTASNADNSTTSANGPWTFTVDTPDPIGAFDLLTPPNGAQVNDTSAVTQIQWQQASDATAFNFVLTRTTDSTTVLDLNFGTEICDGTTCTIPVGADVQALLTDGDYSWDVTASNADNSTTSNNGPWTFTVDTVPATAFACRVDAPAEVTLGDTINVSLSCENVPEPGAYGVQVCLVTDGSTISAQSTAYTPGTLFEGQNTLALVNSVNNAGGCYGLALSGEQPSTLGNISIASTSFTADQVGTVNFTLNDVILGDSQGNPLPAPQLMMASTEVVDPIASLNGTIQLEAGPATSATVTVDGINATITGNADSATFDFDANLPVGTITLQASAPGHLTCTTTLAVNNGENAFPENIVLIAGDVDGDGDVDIADSTNIGLAFGTPGDGSTDLDGNGVVNILDLIFIGRNFDRTAHSCTEQTITDIAVADETFSTLVAALSATGLDATLRGEGPFTVFAPTNAAFDALPEGTLDSLLADLPALTDILLYHVVAGEVDSTAVSTLPSFTTVLGEDVTVTVTADGIFLNDTIQIILTDIPASNGIIHVIDAVLIP